MIIPGNTVTSLAVAAYLLCFGVLAGMAIDRMLYDRQREAVLSRYDHAVAEWQQLRMSWEQEEGRKASGATRVVTSEP